MVYLQFFRVVLTLQFPPSAACVCCVVRCGHCRGASRKQARYRLTSCCQSKACTPLFFPSPVASCFITAVGLLLLMSGNFPLSLSLRFYPFYIYFYSVVSNQHNCASLWDVWLVCAYIQPLSVPGITLLDGGDANSSMK